MINKLSRDALNLLHTFVKERAIKIVNDEDLDGIFATRFLTSYFRNIGIEVEYLYPNTIRELVFIGGNGVAQRCRVL